MTTIQLPEDWQRQVLAEDRETVGGLTAVGVLNLIEELQVPSADPATIERAAGAVLVAMRELNRESRWWAGMRTVEIPDNEQAAKFISEAAVRALQGEA